MTAPYLFKICLAAGDQNTVIIVARDDTLVNRVVVGAAGDLDSGGVAPVALDARIGADVTVADDVVGSPCYDIYTRPRGIGERQPLDTIVVRFYGQDGHRASQVGPVDQNI